MAQGSTRIVEISAQDQGLLRQLGVIEIDWGNYVINIHFGDAITIANAKAAVEALMRMLPDIAGFSDAPAITIGESHNNIRVGIHSDDGFKSDRVREALIEVLRPRLTGRAEVSVALLEDSTAAVGLLLRFVTKNGRPNAATLAAIMAAPDVTEAIAKAVEAAAVPLGLSITDDISVEDGALPFPVRRAPAA